MASAQEPPVSTVSPSKASQGLADAQQQQRRAAQQPMASEPALHSPLPQSLDLASMHVIVTGATSGIGLEAAKVRLGCGQAPRPPRLTAARVLPPGAPQADDCIWSHVKCMCIPCAAACSPPPICRCCVPRTPTASCWATTTPRARSKCPVTTTANQRGTQLLFHSTCTAPAPQQAGGGRAGRPGCWHMLPPVQHAATVKAPPEVGTLCLLTGEHPALPVQGTARGAGGSAQRPGGLLPVRSHLNAVSAQRRPASAAGLPARLPTSQPASLRPLPC